MDIFPLSLNTIGFQFNMPTLIVLVLLNIQEDYFFPTGAGGTLSPEDHIRGDRHAFNALDLI